MLCFRDFDLEKHDVIILEEKQYHFLCCFSTFVTVSLWKQKQGQRNQETEYKMKAALTIFC